jgi:ribosome-associated translation inhibitor RaiA
MDRAKVARRRKRARRRNQRELQARLHATAQPIEYDIESDESDAASGDSGTSDKTPSPTPPWRVASDAPSSGAASSDAARPSSSESGDSMDTDMDEQARIRKTMQMRQRVHDKLRQGFFTTEGSPRVGGAARGVRDTRSAIEEDEDLLLNDHYMRTQRDKPSRASVESAADAASGDESAPPMLFEKLEALGLDDGGYASTSSSSSAASASPETRAREDRAFASYMDRDGRDVSGGAGGAAQFDWLGTVGCGMFPNMPEDIVRMLLTLSSVRAFVMGWVGFRHLTESMTFTRTLTQWHFMIREMGACVHHEWYNEQHHEYCLVVTFRDFEPDEMAELEQMRAKLRGTTLRAADFAAYASDFLRAHVVFRVRRGPMRAACIQAEADRKHAARQRARDASDEATRFSTVERASAQDEGGGACIGAGSGALRLEREQTDLEALDEAERRLEEQLNKRKRNETFREIEQLRARGGAIRLPLHKVYLLWV